MGAPHNIHILRILILEDNPSDAELMERELKNGDIAFTSMRVEKEGDFLHALKDFDPDLILADYTLPAYNGLSALAAAIEEKPGTPFIFVSGTILEDMAIEALKAGATDYVLKNRLQRLLPAVNRALEEKSEREKRKAAESALRERRKELESMLQQLNALRTIDNAITGSLDLALTLDVFIQQVVAHLNVDAATVFLADHEAQSLECAAFRGFRREGMEKMRFFFGEGLAGKTVFERKVLSIPDLRTFPETEEMYTGEDFISCYCAPLISKGDLLGVLEVFTRTPLVAGSEWLEFLKTLSGQAAIAINIAMLFENLQRINSGSGTARDTPAL